MNQRSSEGLSAFHRRFAPHILLHRFRGGNPGSARLAPTRRACNRFLEAELIGQGCGVLEGLLPLGSHVGETLLYYLRSRQCRVEVLEATQSRSVHPLEIELDAFLGDVPVHPVPPDTRARRFWRIFKPLPQWVVGTLSGNNPCSKSKKTSDITQRGGSREPTHESPQRLAFSHKIWSVRW